MLFDDARGCSESAEDRYRWAEHLPAIAFDVSAEPTDRRDIDVELPLKASLDRRKFLLEASENGLVVFGLLYNSPH